MKKVQYYIVAVRYDHKHHISRVRLLQNGHTFDESKIFVLLGLTSDHLIKTAYQTTAGNYREGAVVTSVTIDGICYLKTEPNQIQEDNLGELPEF